MPPFSYPRFGLHNRGLENQTSAYANLWIKSQAFLALGDYEMAFNIIGNMDIYPYRGVLVHSDRFWNDVGIVAELAGKEDANIYYAIGYITRKYDRYYPAGAFSMGPMVLDVPDPRMPCYMSFGNRFHIAGSPFSFIAMQMNMMGMGVFEDQKRQAATRALNALEIAERRHIRPDVCRALRGRIYYSGEDFKRAHVELKAARESFRERGEVDAGTSLLLGMLELQGTRYQSAARYIEESVEKDPTSAVGWRSLGVVYANLGLSDRAIGAMDKALAIEPNSVSGLYNRGLYHYQEKDYLAAVADLDRAHLVEPENREVERLLRMAGQGHVAMGGSPADLPDLTGNYEYDVATGATVPLVEVDAEQLLAQLESDIESFFTVPDSLQEGIRNSDEVLAELEAGYRRDGDLRARKILALAYIDRKELAKAQALLAPGWGVDLEPDEEIMLLYTDRMLGEQERARVLADQLVAGQASTDNPYIWAMTALIMRDDPRAAGFSLVNYRYFNKTTGPAAYQHSGYLTMVTTTMYHGFSNIRSSFITPDGDRMPMEYPWFKTVERNMRSGGSSSGGGGGKKSHVK
jgi:tetratricopeptide (TPR) repeat protein